MSIQNDFERFPGFHEKNIRLREEEKFLRILSSNGE